METDNSFSFSFSLSILLVFLLTACAAPPTTLPPPGVVTSAAPGTGEFQTRPSTPTRPQAQTPTSVTFLAPAPLPDPSCCALGLVADGLERPTFLTSAGDDRLFVLEQPGRIRVIANGGLLDTPFLDITGVVNDSANEQGLLGLAFHPDYANNGQFFVNYTDTNGVGDTVVARYTVSADPNVADPGSAEILFTLEQPYANHNGGGMAFGPDGLLYIGTGDGGGQGDPNGNAQNPYSYLGKLLRLDLNQDPNQPLIWTMGLRNPWRFSFDRATGDLYIGDVGQWDWEEIDFVPAPLAGAPNFGWNALEGTHKYQGARPGDVFTAPAAEYSHGEGCSVTGGYVYRGAALPELASNYFFGDYCSGTIWSLTPTGSGQWERNVFMETGFDISSFGEDVNGELYVIDHGGVVYGLVSK